MRLVDFLKGLTYVKISIEGEPFVDGGNIAHVAMKLEKLNFNLINLIVKLV